MRLRSSSSPPPTLRHALASRRFFWTQSLLLPIILVIILLSILLSVPHSDGASLSLRSSLSSLSIQFGFGFGFCSSSRWGRSQSLLPRPDTDSTADCLCDRTQHQQPKRRVGSISWSSSSVVSVTALRVTSKSGAKLLEASDDFHSVVVQASVQRPVMVFYTAPWCGPCRLSTPVVQDIMQRYRSEMDTIEVCTDECPDLCAHAGVRSIPTLQLWNQGRLIDTIVGAVAPSVLSSAVQKVVTMENPAAAAAAAVSRLGQQGSTDGTP